MIKVAAPNMALQVIDWAIQAHGAAGVCEDFALARMYADARTLRLADGPDEVHRNQIGNLELRAPWLSAATSLAAVRSAQPRRAPQTSLWYNLEVSSKRHASKPAFICYDNAITYAAVEGRGRTARGLPAEALRRRQGRSRAALRAEQLPVRHRLLRDPARRRGRGADQPDEPHGGAAPLSSPTAAPRTAFIGAGALAPGRAARGDGTFAHVVVAAYSDYLHEAHGPHRARRVQAARASRSRAGT